MKIETVTEKTTRLTIGYKDIISIVGEHIQFDIPLDAEVSSQHGSFSITIEWKELAQGGET